MTNDLLEKKERMLEVIDNTLENIKASRDLIAKTTTIEELMEVNFFLLGAIAPDGENLERLAIINIHCGDEKITQNVIANFLKELPSTKELFAPDTSALN